MEMKRKKVIRVLTGTDISMVSPSHPLSVVSQIRKVIDRILGLDETEFEYSCNSQEGLAVFQYYGMEHHPSEISVEYYLNGTKVGYDDAVADLERGKGYVEQLIGKKI